MKKTIAAALILSFAPSFGFAASDVLKDVQKMVSGYHELMGLCYKAGQEDQFYIDHATSKEMPPSIKKRRNLCGAGQ
jgi:hypothetical protein